MATGDEPDEIELPYEPTAWHTKLGDKFIKLQRLANDVIVFSMGKFGVPMECLRKTECLRNNYGSNDFLLVVSRAIFRFQIKCRFYWNNIFKQKIPDKHFKLKTLSDLAQGLWTDSLYRTAKFSTCFLLSLAATNELILYLYSNNFHLHVETLASLWSNWLQRHKAEFQDSGGLLELYRIGLGSNFYYDDDINHLFFRQRCKSYEASANNPVLYEEWKFVFIKYWEIALYKKTPPSTALRGGPDIPLDKLEPVYDAPTVVEREHNLQQERSSSLTGVGQKRSSSLTGVGQERSSSLTSVGQERYSSLTGVGQERSSSLTGVGQERSSSLTGVGQQFQQMVLNALGRNMSSKNKPGVSEIPRTLSQKPTGTIPKNQSKPLQGSSAEDKGQNIPCLSEEPSKERTYSDSSEDKQSDKNEPGFSGIPEGKSTLKIAVASSQKPLKSSQKKWQKMKSKKKKSSSTSRK